MRSGSTTAWPSAASKTMWPASPMRYCAPGKAPRAISLSRYVEMRVDVRVMFIFVRSGAFNKNYKRQANPKGSKSLACAAASLHVDELTVALRFVQEEGRGRRNIERFDARAHGDEDELVGVGY